MQFCRKYLENREKVKHLRLTLLCIFSSLAKSHGCTAFYFSHDVLETYTSKSKFFFEKADKSEVANLAAGSRIFTFYTNYTPNLEISNFLEIALVDFNDTALRGRQSPKV